MWLCPWLIFLTIWFDVMYILLLLLAACSEEVYGMINALLILTLFGKEVRSKSSHSNSTRGFYIQESVVVMTRRRKIPSTGISRRERLPTYCCNCMHNHKKTCHRAAP